MPRNSEELDNETMALKIFEEFYNRRIHSTMAYNHIRFLQGFETITDKHIYRGLHLLFKKGILTDDPEGPYGVRYLWTELGQQMSIEKLSTLLKKPIRELRIPLDIPLDQEYISALRKTGRARILLYLIENKLRHFVSSKLRDIDENWLETRIAESIRRSWESNKEREKKQFPFLKLIDHDLIFYSDFKQLRLVIINNENWSQVFSKFFGKPEGITTRIADIEGIRNLVMHNRMISDEDLEWLRTSYDHIRCIVEKS